MTIIGLLLLIVAGIILLLVEFLVVPGVTIAGIGGFLCLAGAVFLSFDSFGNTAGLIVLGAVLLIMIISLLVALRSGTWKRVSLQTDIDSRVSEVEKSGLKAGDQGIALTRLNPIGSVLINDIKLEGRSQGPLIVERTSVEVIKVTHTHVIVKPIEKL